MRVTDRFLWPFLALLFAGTPVRARVVISEIHYHPPSPDGKTLEFVELFNASDTDVSLGGWHFSSGLAFAFPRDAVIRAGDYVVVCKDRVAFFREFGLRNGIHGNFEGSLDNGGEEIALSDDSNAVIDVVRYDDDRPWPEFADGRGASLQRLCADAPSHRLDNWAGAPIDLPTPRRANSREACPLPQRTVPPVVITEIHYHPLSDFDELEEYVEIHNPGEEPVAIGGWRFDQGLAFTFPDDTVIEPGAYLVVCRNQANVRALHGIDNTVGDFGGQLSNRGERVTLVDTQNRVIDSVAYSDQGEWDFGADGEGRSLERIVATGDSEDPANWTHSFFRNSNPDNSENPDFVHVESTGFLANLPAQKLTLGVNGTGEFIVDNVVLERLDAPGMNLLPNGDFEEGQGDWRFSGVATGSSVEDGIGVDGGPGLRLVSTGECLTDPCGGFDSASLTLPALPADVEYRLSLDFRYVSGRSTIYAQMLQGLHVPFDRAMVSPGSENTVAAPVVPPHVWHRGRFPRMPTPDDRVRLSVRVRTQEADRPLRVFLDFFLGDVDPRNDTRVEMFDDGGHHDGFPDDGVYGAEVPPFPHNTQVRYTITVESAGGVLAVSPTPLDREARRSEEVWGYYVDALQPESSLPVYHILHPDVNPDLLQLDPEFINGGLRPDRPFLKCEVLSRGSFVFQGELYPDVGLRWRGNTACWIQKRNFKLKFNRGRDFRGVRKVNLQGLWTDKAIVREHLAWEFFRELGVPYCETEFIRVHVNGVYHGLFMYLEHPDQRMLRRLGLDPSGCLYKANQPDPNDTNPRGVEKQPDVETYEKAWEKETCESRDLSRLAGFIDDLHEDDASPGGPTLEFHETRVFQEWMVGYQVGQVILDNVDSFAKNHFLYSPSDEDRWGLITWDMDLVFGKFFTRAAVDRFPDGERPVGTLNDCMQCPFRDLRPWFSTAINGEILRHHMVDKFFRAGDGFYQRAYLVRLWDVIREKYRNDIYDPRIDDLVEFLKPEIELDLNRWGRYLSNPPCVVPDDVEFNVEVLKEQIDCHRNGSAADPGHGLIPYIERRHPEVIDHPRMKITEIMYNPEGPDEDGEFIELMNTSGRPIDISGWGFHDGVIFFFEPGVTVQTDEVIIVARDPDFFRQSFPGVTRRVFGPFLAGRLSNEGETLRLKDAGPGYPATIDFVEYDDGERWPDGRDGFSLELVDVAPDLDNDRPENWRLSAGAGGTPGALASSTDFVRGDADGDGVANITDALVVLRALFLRGDPPACEDAADADDDGRVVITDPIFLLNFLFQGGETIPAPHPLPGPDPTADELSCS